MVDLVRTDFQQQGINALNTGLGIGGIIQQNRQVELENQRQSALDQQQQQLFGQKMQLGEQRLQSGQQDVSQQERVSGMGEMITALNLPYEKRQELFAELEATKQNPDAKAALSHLQTLGDQEQLETMMLMINAQQDTQKSKGLPSETLAFNELIKDFTPKQQNTARMVKAGLKGRAVSNALLSAIESGDVKNLADAKAEIKQAEKFSEMTAISRGNTIDKGFESIQKIDAGMKNIDDAIRVLDSGAGVGAIEKLWPSIKSASVELDNIRGRMALDVVGAVSFGALSKGELDLAKDVALPTGLDTAELKTYLLRKKEAQGKLRNYYNEQIQFLDQGGTVAGFLRMKERGGQQPPSTAQDQTFPGAPPIGQVSDGYIYNGGDPSLQSSWSKK